jgi:hypothetical protein
VSTWGVPEAAERARTCAIINRSGTGPRVLAELRRPFVQDSAVPAAARPDRWPAWVADVVAEIDLDDVCERIVERDTAIAFPTLVDDEEFREHLRASVRENLRCLHQVLAGRRALDSVLLERPLDFARLQARLRIPQTALQRSYRVGFATFWEAMADQLSKVAARTGVSRDESLQGLSQLTRTMLDTRTTRRHRSPRSTRGWTTRWAGPGRTSDRDWSASSCAGRRPPSPRRS